MAYGPGTGGMGCGVACCVQGTACLENGSSTSAKSSHSSSVRSWGNAHRIGMAEEGKDERSFGSGTEEGRVGYLAGSGVEAGTAGGEVVGLGIGVDLGKEGDAGASRIGKGKG